jgi:putative NADH-flavin reductase
MRLFLLGATGNSGRRILRFALGCGHEVTALVRNQNKLVEVIGSALPHRLRVIVGDIDCSVTLAEVMAGHDVVINAAGYVTDGEAFTWLVQIAIDAASAALGEGGRFWQFGGAAVLDIPGAGIKGVDLPMVPKVYEAHRTNLIALETSGLDWSMLCPGPMIEALDGKPTSGLRVSVDQWPMARPAYTRLMPQMTLALAFKQAVPELTVSYEDAATIILGNLAKNGPFSRRRVGLALPAGMRSIKREVPV